MKITMKSLDNLTPYFNNAKVHTPEQVEKIANSIKEFGFLVPIVIDADNVIIAGHGRYEAARHLGLDEAPTISAGNLTPEQIRAFRIADNKVAESDWINEMLETELIDLAAAGFDVTLTGFDLADITGKEDELEKRILAETEIEDTDTTTPEDIGKQITARLEEIAAADPARFEKADAIILPLRKGSRECFVLADPNTADAIQELKRYHAAGEPSPLECLLKNIFSMRPQKAIAFSGGADSMVLLDIIYKRTDARPSVIFADSQMEHPDTLPFIKMVCRQYGAPLHIARAARTPLEQWQKQGWPMLGKLAARLYMQTHKSRGFKVDVSSCCRNMKIAPARKMMKALGVNLHFTGQRGQSDDALRGLRSIKDGAIKYLKTDKMTVCNPLTGWTDTMVRRYTEENALPVHPSKAAGAVTIGCLYCGGGAQFTNSGFRILRQVKPDAWRRFMVDWKAGEIILAIKHDEPLEKIRRTIDRIGGLEYLAETHPHLFDFLRQTPLEGYHK